MHCLDTACMDWSTCAEGALYGRCDEGYDITCETMGRAVY